MVQVFGSSYFLMIYFGGVYVGNVLSYYFHKNDLWYAAIGASAGVNALVFSFITLSPWKVIWIFAIIPVPAILFALGYLWYTIKGTQDAYSRIGHEAHFGGAIAGVLMTLVLDFRDAFTAHPWVAIILLGALGYGFYYMKNKNL